MKRTIAMMMLSMSLGGCLTQFTGAAKVSNGPTGCKKACDEWGMDLAGMVKMGEYSDGCICQVRGAAPGSKAPGTPTSDASTPERGGLAGQPAVAGVYIQMQAAAAAAEAQAGSFHRATQQTSGYRPGSPLGRD